MLLRVIRFPLLDQPRLHESAEEPFPRLDRSRTVRRGRPSHASRDGLEGGGEVLEGGAEGGLLLRSERREPEPAAGDEVRLARAFRYLPGSVASM